MKKQILFSAIMALTGALSYGQSSGHLPPLTLSKGTAPTPVTCAGTPENPIIGREYTYEGTSHTTGKYHIFATAETNFITGGNLNTSNAYTVGNQLIKATSYNNANNTSNQAKIAWSASATNPSFVVIQYTEESGCNTNNLKVYKVVPKNAFTIELRNMTATAGTGAGTKTFTTEDLGKNIDVCLAKVEGATYNTATNQIEFDYGKQSLYYELIAANYDKTFTPKVKVTGLQAGQTAELKWGSAKDDINNSVGVITENTEVSLPQMIIDSAAKPEEGVSVYFELIVKNGTYEGLTDQDIVLSVDATTGTANNKDVKVDCTEESDFGDKATQKLTKRPAVKP